MEKKINLQDLFLARAYRDKLHVTAFLINGFQLRGTVSGFDSFVVLITTEGKQQMIYKHAISTIVPERPIPLEEAAR